jgi:endonuclease/exonuclease/phosphatase family metal-dependent hydrolase
MRESKQGRAGRGVLVRAPRLVRLGTANLRWGMSRDDLTAAGRTIASRLDVIGFQELRAPAGQRAVRRGLRERAALGWRDGGECPQAFAKTTLEVVRGSRHYLEAATPGLRGVTPRLPILQVAYRHRQDPGIRFVVYSTHLVPLGGPGSPRTDHTAWRRERWDAHWAELARLVGRDTEDGWTVFVLGDINDGAAPHDKIGELHPSARWLHRSGVDWIVVAGEGRSCRVRRLRSFRLRTGSDHLAPGVSLLLTGVGRGPGPTPGYRGDMSLGLPARAPAA